MEKSKELLLVPMEYSPHTQQLMSRTIDPVCLSHGIPHSQNPPHWAGRCLICQLCFEVLNSLEECNPTGDGKREDVHINCAIEEREIMNATPAKNKTQCLKIHKDIHTNNGPYGFTYCPKCDWYPNDWRTQ